MLLNLIPNKNRLGVLLPIIQSFCIVLMGLFIILVSTPTPLSAKNQPIGFKIIGNSNSITIPIETHNNLILLPVKINNSININFILDTGARTTILTEPVLSEFMHIENTRTTLVRGLGQGKEIEAQVATGLTMSIPGIVGHNLNMLILPEGILSFSEIFGKPVYGIIGNELFKQFVVEINYDKEYITLTKPNKYKPKRKMQAFPLEIIQGKPYIKMKINNYAKELKEAKLLIDTGATQGLSIFNPALDIPHPDNNIPAYLGRGLSGDIYGQLARVSKIHIGNFTLNKVITSYPDSSSLQINVKEIKCDGNIGAEVLRRFLVVIDYHGKRLFLKKNNNYKKRFTYNASGLEIAASGLDYHTYTITQVRPGSPADKAGLKVNDEVLRIGNLSNVVISLGQIYGFFNQKEGKKIKLLIKRGTQKMKKKLILEYEI